MLEILRRYLETARTYWTGLSRTQQVLVLAMVLSLVAGVATLLVWAGRTEYATLFASLTPEDTGAIVSQLKAAKIPYRVDEASGVVQVPSRQVYETRLKLASQGLPTGGGVGFELFDKTSFGVTDFAQKLNFQRALQGELARTISQLREVQQARVHLVLPQPSLFTERDKPATASVVLRLRPGSQLSGAQVRGIVHLVAGSVEGLTPERWQIPATCCSSTRCARNIS